MFFLIVGHEVSTVRGIKGLASGVFFDNLGGSFLEVSFTLCYNFVFTFKFFSQTQSVCSNYNK